MEWRALWKKSIFHGVTCSLKKSIFHSRFVWSFLSFLSVCWYRSFSFHHFKLSAPGMIDIILLPGRRVYSFITSLSYMSDHTAVFSIFWLSVKIFSVLFVCDSVYLISTVVLATTSPSLLAMISSCMSRSLFSSNNCQFCCVIFVCRMLGLPGKTLQTHEDVAQTRSNTKINSLHLTLM